MFLNHADFSNISNLGTLFFSNKVKNGVPSREIDFLLLLIELFSSTKPPMGIHLGLILMNGSINK